MHDGICNQYVFGCLTELFKESKFLQELILVTSKLNYALQFYLLYFQNSSLKTKKYYMNGIMRSDFLIFGHGD